ncbi:4Fe-4S dicluster domain-containing protein [Oleidesulfovibrio sp.]|uniref:4Fe-4S dicluster domain-containing protein n=1 Tax=Oleidesulfovibrio sp. TaxID=2909707 RepID=UPI003A865CB1
MTQSGTSSLSNKSPDRNTRVSRRKFLTTLGVAGIAGAAVTSLPAKAAAATPQNAAEPMATMFDLTKCVGCGACVSACHARNGHKYPEPEKPFPAMFPDRAKPADWSSRRDVEDRLTPYNWLTVQQANVTYNGQEYDLNIPRRCMHCDNPLCANLCPWGASYKEDSGTVRIDPDICLGGAKCRQACPWNIPQRQTGVGLYLDIMPRFAGNGVMYKCDRCHDSVKQGEQPACVEACPYDVQQIGPRDEIIAKAKQLAQSISGFIYGLEEAGGTSTVYVSPVPFKLLDMAIKHGKGSPHLKPVKNALAPQEKLTRALVLAPFAGLAAGTLKMVSVLRNERKTPDTPAEKNSSASKGARHE